MVVAINVIVLIAVAVPGAAVVVGPFVCFCLITGLI